MLSQNSAMVVLWVSWHLQRLVGSNAAMGAKCRVNNMHHALQTFTLQKGREVRTVSFACGLCGLKHFIVFFAGFGRFQLLLLCFSGSAWFADAMEVMLLSFLSITVRKHSHCAAEPFTSHVDRLGLYYNLAKCAALHVHACFYL